MNLFGFEIRRRRAPRIMLRGPQLTEEKINDALAVAETHPTYCAVLQLIETAKENAQLEAQRAADNPTAMAGYVGGSAHLMLLRDDILERREQTLEARRPKQQPRPPADG